MATTVLLLGLLAGSLLAVTGQEIRDNLTPKAGDICRDRGDQWRNIKLGPCEEGSRCQVVKRGVYKCVPTDERGNLKIGTACYNEALTDQKNRTKGERWRTYFRERNCVFKGTDKQGTPLVQCVQTADNTKVYRCAQVPDLGSSACYTVAGSMIWGRWNDNQMYDACNGCPCTPPGKVCKTGSCKYPTCQCDKPCDQSRLSMFCATS